MTSIFLPIGNAIAADIRDLKQSGFLHPVRQRDPALLLTDWDGTMHGIVLTGAHDFMFFPVKIENPHTGLFVPAPEILIDFSSAETGAGYERRNGDLLLEKGKLSIIAIRVGDHFPDPIPVPLWPTVTGGSDAAKVVFTRWEIGVRDGDRFVTLWERKAVAKSTVAFSEDA